jgi:hypothetical protein
MILVPVLHDCHVRITLEQLRELAAGEDAGRLISSALLVLGNSTLSQHLVSSARRARGLSETLSHEATLNVEDGQRLAILIASRLASLGVVNGVRLACANHGITRDLSRGRFGSRRLRACLLRLLRRRGDRFGVGGLGVRKLGGLVITHDTILQQKSPGDFAGVFLSERR